MTNVSSESDIRFQFETIKHLAESIRMQTAQLADMSRQQREMNERLIRIEENKHGEELSELRAIVDRLNAESLRRDGANGIIRMIMRSPAIGWLVAGAGAVWAIIEGKIRI